MQVAVDLGAKADKAAGSTSETMELEVDEHEEDSRRIMFREIERECRVNSNLISFEDTNLLPHNYMEVLQHAAKYRRTVRFVRWGQEVPVVPLKDLVMRN
eukprot:gene38537-47587_t